MGCRILYMVILSLAFVHAGLTQSIYEKINKLSIHNNRDSAYNLIHIYENHYLKSEQWDSLSRLYLLKGDLHIRTDGYAAAIPYYKKAEELLKKYYSKDNVFYLYYLHAYARILLEMGKIKEADKNIDYIYRVAFTHSYEKLYKKAIIDKVLIFLYQNEYSTADSILQKYISRLEAPPVDTFNLMRAYNLKLWLDNYYHRKVDVIEIAHKNINLVISRYGSHHPNTAIGYSTLATAYEATGQLKLAFKYMFKSRDILYNDYLINGNSSFLASILINIGLSYKKIGEYKLATQYLLTGLDLQSAYLSENNINLLWIYHAITETYIADGQYNLAKKYNDKSRNINSNSSEGNTYQQYFILAYDAQILYNEGNLDMSLNQALQVYHYLITSEDELTTDLISILNLISLDYLSLQEPKLALRWAYRQFYAASKYYALHHSEVLLSLTNILEARIQLKDETAIYSIRDSILRIWNIDNSPLSIKNCAPDKWFILYAEEWVDFLGKDIFNNKDKRQEYFTFLKDFELYYQNHLSIIRTGSKISEHAIALKNIYKPALKYYYKNSSEKYLITVEKIKAFKTKMLVQSQLVQESGVNTPENIINKQLITGSDSGNLNTFMHLGKLFENFKEYRDSLQKFNHLLYLKKYGINNINIDKLKNILYNNEILLEYIKIDSILYLVTFDGSKTITHHIDYKKVNNLLEEHFNARNPETVRKLYKILIPREVNNYDKLLIIPDNKLFYLNYEELIDKTGNFLIKKKEIRYAYSGSVLYYQDIIASQAPEKKNIISLTPGFSDQLKNYENLHLNADTLWPFLLRQPFLLQLSSYIGKLGKSVSIIDTAATEYFYRINAEDYKIIHFGTHGIINDASPLFSRLILVKNQDEDGNLYTYEIYGQHLNSDLVVLSACNTGTGKLISGEGVVSLAHAFTYAGCPTVLMTLWEVDEKTTAAILKKFYANLMKGEKKSVALRKAKLAYLQSAPLEMRSPYYWAGLVLIGSDKPIFSLPWYGNIMFLIPILLLGLILIIFFILRRKNT